MNPKLPRAIKDDGTCTYIILTESPWIQSGGDNNNEYVNPIITTTTRKITKLFIVLFVNDKILAKHDENYMPPEVKEALEKSNNQLI